MKCQYALCALGVLLAPIVAPGEEPSAATDDGTHITIQGKQFEIYPPDKLVARGVRVLEIPRDQNAVFLYFDAINALTPLEDDLGEALRAAAGGEWPAGEAGEKLAAYLDENHTALDLARTAAQMDDYYLPLFRGDTDSLFAALLPTLTPQRQIARMFAADAERRVAAGDHAGAIDNLLTAQRMGHQVGHGSTLIEGLVGIAISAMASDRMTQIAESHDVDSELLQRAVAEMGALSADMPTFDDLVRAEQALSVNFVDDIMQDLRHVGMFTSVDGWGVAPGGDTDSGWNRLFADLRRVYLPDRAMKRNLNKYYDKVREGTRPRDDGTPGTIIEEDKLLEAIPAWDVVTSATVPSLAHAYEMTLRYQSNFERARLRIAAEAYRSDHGRLPPNLPALAPEYVPAVPADPMTGYDFEYEPRKAASGAIAGLEPVTRDNAEALRKKRRTPALLTPRASKWRRYVMAYAERFELDHSQRNSAEAILRDVESRASAFERTQGARIKQLIDAGETEAARDKMGPLDKLYEELKRRLDRLPTAHQRASGAESENARN